MKKLIKKLFAKKRKTRKTKGQSLVEFALTLPILLMLLSGLTEFGFMLNHYLALVDATREIARMTSSWGHDETIQIGGNDVTFYEAAAGTLVNVIEPRKTDSGNPISYDPNDTTRKIKFLEERQNCSDDELANSECNDIIISVYGIDSATGAALVHRHHWLELNPVYGSGPQYAYQHGNGRFTAAVIDQNISAITKVNAGIVLVEVFYNYEQVLGLPWLAMLPDPFLLHAYTIMPLSSAEPAAP